MERADKLAMDENENNSYQSVEENSLDYFILEISKHNLSYVF